MKEAILEDSLVRIRRTEQVFLLSFQIVLGKAEALLDIEQKPLEVASEIMGDENFVFEDRTKGSILSTTDSLTHKSFSD